MIFLQTINFLISSDGLKMQNNIFSEYTLNEDDRGYHEVQYWAYLRTHKNSSVKKC